MTAMTERPHGSRAKYVFEKCRCMPCTDANRDYMRSCLARDRKPYRVRRIHGDHWRVVTTSKPEELVMECASPDEAYETRDHLNATAWMDGHDVRPMWADGGLIAAVRSHIKALGRSGVGYRRIGQLTGIGRSRVIEIARGESTRKDRPRKRRMKYETAQRILGIPLDRAAPGAHVDARETWRMIDEMLAAGATKTRIARELGSRAKVPALQLNRTKVTKAHADAVRKLHDRFFIGSARMREVCRCEELRDNELERRRIAKARSRERIRDRELEGVWA